MQSHILNQKKSDPSLPYFRLSLTGIFMGLANLVPGVSGGTMVLALGLYEEFIDAFSNLTRFKISLRSIIFVGILFGLSAVTIFSMSGVMQHLMESFLPGMLGLFIGMTLGGAPLLYRELKPANTSGVSFALFGIILMGLIAFVFQPEGGSPSWLFLFIGGIVGSSAMILPGISGSYMLLIMGLYLPIIAGVNDFKDALRAKEISLLMSIGMEIILPVALGLLVGLAVLSNVLKYFLKQHHKPTIGFLMGLLLGSVLGLYPFKETRFDKLPRYAVENSEGKQELRIQGFGWKAVESSVIYQNLKTLESSTLQLKVISANTEPFTRIEDLEAAREVGAVCITYDVEVSKIIRRAARDKSLGEVELEIVPNTEYSSSKAVLVLGLMVLGFFTTFLFGKFGEKSEKSKSKNDLESETEPER